MKVSFCASSSDELGLKALKVLQNYGCDTAILNGKGSALPGQVALFTCPNASLLSGAYTMLAAHRLLGLAPAWAKTPFLVALCDRGKESGFETAVRSAAYTYELWFIRRQAQGVPWGMEPRKPNDDKSSPDDEKWQAFCSWRTLLGPAFANLRQLEPTPGLWPDLAERRRKKREKDARRQKNRQDRGGRSW